MVAETGVSGGWLRKLCSDGKEDVDGVIAEDDDQSVGCMLPMMFAPETSCRAWTFQFMYESYPLVLLRIPISGCVSMVNSLPAGKI